MAGYLFLLSNKDSYLECTKNGLYGTYLSPPYWRTHHEGTIADYVTMKKGDNVYFFFDRKIYGIGELAQISSDCKFQNYPNAGFPERPEYYSIKKDLLLDSGESSSNQRFICMFKPSPYFFTEGVDMDDVLASNPRAFRNLRAIWKRSFIKLDDEENQAFKNIILKRNQHVLAVRKATEGTIALDDSSHKRISRMNLSKYSVDTGIKNILSQVSNESKIKHEMAVEMGLLHQISAKEPTTKRIFGNWDFLSHQVIASPFKPIDYMDRMDIFGYSFIPNHRPTIQKYLVIEVKKDSAIPQDIDQLLRYVDWIKDEYCYGDYSMIKSYLVAYNIGNDVINRAQEIGTRRYTIGVRPTQSMKWFDIGLISYRYDIKSGFLSLKQEWDSTKPI